LKIYLINLIEIWWKCNKI